MENTVSPGAVEEGIRLREAIQSAPPASRDTQAQALDAFRADTWLMELASNIGVNTKDIPPEVLDSILVCDSKNWVNRKFFAWYQARAAQTPQSFSPYETQLFKEIVGVKNSAAYTNAKRDLDSNLYRCTDYMKNAQQYLTMAADNRAKIMELEKKDGVDLTEEILKITSSGWYTFSSELTKAYNEANPTQKALVFLTSKVVAKFYNKKAGIELDVNLGTFEVMYKPTKNDLRVHQHEDNLIVDRIYHPHVDSSGSVCWGNAQQTYVQSMQNLEPSKAFLALQVILTNYNDESPFRDLFDFAVIRDPKILEGRPEVFASYDTSGAWFLDDDISPSISGRIDTTTDDDGCDRVLMRLYRKVYQGTNVSVGGVNEYYFKTNNGEYIPVDVAILDWE